MRRFLTELVSVFLVTTSLVSVCGCKIQKSPSVDSGAYLSSTFLIPEKDGYESSFQGVLKDGNNACIPIVYTQYDDKGLIKNQITDIYTVNESGERVYTLEVMGNQAPIAVMEDEYAFLGYSIDDINNFDVNLNDLQGFAVFFDKKTGDLVRTIETDFSPHFISTTSDGFVIGGYSIMSKYSKEGTLLNTLKLDFPCLLGCECFFEDDGHYYVIEEKDLGYVIYHEVNFETGENTAIASNEDIGILGMNISGNYFFNPDGEYKVDLKNMQVGCLASWNNIDIRPPKKLLDTPSEYYRLDDERFALSYQYRDGTSEVLIFHYDSSIDRSNVEMIIIGGYNIYSDPVLLWAVYNFNTTNTKYRVILEEYGLRFDKYSPQEGHTGRLALTQYFNEGNTPDLFYGTRFDYSYMGRNGMVIDMSSYMNSPGISFPALTDAAQRLFYEGNGACYQLFAGYLLYGRSVQEDVIRAVDNTSVFSLFEYARKNGIVYSTDRAADVVDAAIRYNFADLWGAYDGKRKISHEDLFRLVSVALSLPLAETIYASEEDVINGKTLMSTTSIYSDLSEIRPSNTRFCYIGYPSIYNSVHLAQPECCCAISSTAKNKDKCWEFLLTLFSDDAQKQVLISGYIPTTQNMVDTFCEISMQPERVTDEVLRSLVRNQQAYSQEKVDVFLETIDKADTVKTQDYGVYDIICDEISSYYSQKRTVEQIVTTLEQRLNLYCQENYM